MAGQGEGSDVLPLVVVDPQRDRQGGQHYSGDRDPEEGAEAARGLRIAVSADGGHHEPNPISPA